MKARLSHIAILVKDLKKAKEFYGGLLGLQEIDRPPFFIKGAWYDLGTFELHLMLHENTARPSIHPLNETVQPHFALSLKANDMTSLIDKLKNMGVNFVSESETEQNNVRQVFLYDFDDNMLELNNEEKVNINETTR